MPTGGARRGSGRKKGKLDPKTIEKHKMRDYLIQRVASEFGPIMDAQIELAKGVRVAKEITMNDEEGNEISSTVIVYQKPPDREAAKMLIDQSIGKAKESVELSGHVDFSLKKLADEAAKTEKTKR